jgi:hypothetical protein
MLADLLAYQASMRRERQEALDRMAQERQAAGLYEANAGQRRPSLPRIKVVIVPMFDDYFSGTSFT